MLCKLTDHHRVGEDARDPGTLLAEGAFERVLRGDRAVLALELRELVEEPEQVATLVGEEPALSVRIEHVEARSRLCPRAEESRLAGLEVLGHLERSERIRQQVLDRRAALTASHAEARQCDHHGRRVFVADVQVLQRRDKVGHLRDGLLAGSSA